MKNHDENIIVEERISVSQVKEFRSVRGTIENHGVYKLCFTYIFLEGKFGESVTTRESEAIVRIKLIDANECIVLLKCIFFSFIIKNAERIPATIYFDFKIDRREDNLSNNLSQNAAKRKSAILEKKLAAVEVSLNDISIQFEYDRKREFLLKEATGDKSTYTSQLNLATATFCTTSKMLVH